MKNAIPLFILVSMIIIISGCTQESDLTIMGNFSLYFDCTDSDDGKNPYMKGITVTTTTVNGEITETSEFTDHCVIYSDIDEPGYPGQPREPSSRT